MFDNNYKKFCFLKKIDCNTYQETEDNIVVKEANKLKQIEITQGSNQVIELRKIIGQTPVIGKLSIPLLPIKFINGIVIDLDDFNKIIESYEPTIFDFITKLKDYIQKKYDKNGELLINILQKGITSKNLDGLLSALLNKSNYNIFGNKTFTDQVGNTSDLQDSDVNEIPKEVYLKIFLQIMYKIIYTKPIYKRAKITNIRNNSCSLITYDINTSNEIVSSSNNNMTIFQNNFNEIINYDITTIKQSSDIFIEYEKPINFIIKYFENLEIGSYADCKNIQYYNVFKNKLLTILSLINSQKISNKLKEETILSGSQTLFEDAKEKFKANKLKGELKGGKIKRNTRKYKSKRNRTKNHRNTK